MKRALAIAVAVCTLGVAGFSQIGPITGSWTATVGLVPAPTLTSALTLNYTVAGFTVTSVSDFGLPGLTGQRFGLRGAFGPFTVTGDMWFNVAVPEYMGSRIVTSFDFGGITLGMRIMHWDPDYAANFFESLAVYPFNRPFREWPILIASPVAPEEPGDLTMMYIFTATVSPISIRTTFTDGSGGIEFHDVRFTLTGVGLCCGITYNAELLISKEDGFETLTLTGVNIPLGLGVSFDVGVTYSVTAKSVTLTPRFAGIGDVCFGVWASPVQTPTNVWEGIRVDGFRIRCALGDCNYIEYVHAWVPGSSAIPSAIRGKFLTALAENEYLELGFCGAGCCGGRWDATLRVLWSTTPSAHGVGIFGTTRFVGAVNVPIMTNFTTHVGFTMPTFAMATPPTGAGPAFTIGWTLTF